MKSIALLPGSERRRLIDNLSEAEAAALRFHWPSWARPGQLPPGGDWTVWLLLAGRGFGKTRVGAEWVRGEVCGATPLGPGRYRRLALVAETAADARDVMVEGESGLLAVHPAEFRPRYEPSKRRISWPNGAIPRSTMRPSRTSFAGRSTTRPGVTSWRNGATARPPGTCCNSACAWASGPARW